MTKLFFKNVHTGRRYELIKINKNIVTLKGELAEFTLPMTKEEFMDFCKRNGYVPEMETSISGA
jgi:hypothetical protein